LALLEKLLDGLIGSCGMEKAFLFDVVSKIYVATDSNPVDMQTSVPSYLVRYFLLS
jgi:Ras-related GTP-binding protein C/D